MNLQADRPENIEVENGGPKTVYFFGTCVVDITRPNAGLAAIRLLKKCGVSVRFPGGQTCCGQPAYNSGYTKEAANVAAAQLGLFNQKIPIIVPSASCAEMFHEHYPILFAGSPLAEKAAEVAGRVFEWGYFMEHILQATFTDKGPPVKAFCHVSCHGRAFRQTVQRLLGKLANVTMIQLPHESECCGFGGAFSVKHTDISGRMVNNKVDEILASEIDVFISNDSSCMLNIQGALEKRGHRIPCYHLAEFIMERAYAT